MGTDGCEPRRAERRPKCLILRWLWSLCGSARTEKNGGERSAGAQGRNRTTDTCIFSAVLYQLSYLGAVSAGRRITQKRGAL
jgi:hypothetical protein